MYQTAVYTMVSC